MISYSPEDTMMFAGKLASKAGSGDVICLCGQLGAGKTAFAKGFAIGLGIKEHVNSPTFTLVQIYNNGRLPLYHFDLYRLTEFEDTVQIDPDTLEDIGFFEYMNADGVCLIEWAEYARNFIPDGATWVEIKISENFRIIKVKRGDI